MKYFALSLCLFTTLTSCTGETEEPVEPMDPYDVDIGPYAVDIRWTDYGIPHILAEDYGSLSLIHI